LTREDSKRMKAVMKGYERKSKLPHYDVWGKLDISYEFKAREFSFVTSECPKITDSNNMALDAGCGSGRYSSMLSSKGYIVIGLDVSAGMLRIAKNSVRQDNVFFVRGTLTNLPLRSHNFDLTLCIGTLHHLTNSYLEKALGEFQRTIRTGGSLITDIRNSLNPMLYIQYRLQDAKWTDVAGLTLKARSMISFKRKLHKFGFKVEKAKGIGFFNTTFAPFIVTVSKAVA